MTRLVVQRMQLGEPDASGRRRPVPIEGDVYEMEADTVVMAVSQQPDWSTLGALAAEGSWLDVDAWGRTGIERVWSGGDTLRLGLATISIGQGRKAAESIHAALRGLDIQAPTVRTPIRSDKIKLDYYEAKSRAERQVLAPAERLSRPMDEVDLGLDRAQAIEETARCFSCGLCFGCERCWMYCQSNCFKKLPSPGPGTYYKIDLNVCDGCRKCAEECPCGFLDLI